MHVKKFRVSCISDACQNSSCQMWQRLIDYFLVDLMVPILNERFPTKLRCWYILDWFFFHFFWVNVFLSCILYVNIECHENNYYSNFKVVQIRQYSLVLNFDNYLMVWVNLLHRRVRLFEEEKKMNIEKIEGPNLPVVCSAFCSCFSIQL